MMINPPRKFVAFLLLLTFALLVLYQYGLKRVITINASSQLNLLSIDDRTLGGQSTSTLEKSGDKLVLNCELSHSYQWPYCSLVVHTHSQFEGWDLSNFTHIELDVETFGAGMQDVRVYLKNFNPVYSVKGAPNTYKINELQYSPRWFSRPLSIPLANFQVASWWIDSLNIPPQHASSELTNVIALEIATGNNPPVGLHQIKVNSIALVGKWLSSSEMLSLILTMWVIAAIVYLLQSFRAANLTIDRMRKREKELEEVAGALELEKQELIALASQDHLTGVLNRLGLGEQFSDALVNFKRKGEQLSVVMMDLDYFKPINDNYGHDVGDKVLKNFAKLVSEHCRPEDIFGRWGGEEFILLCPNSEIKSAQNLAEKLRVLTEDNAWPENMMLTCSFGVAQLQTGEKAGEFLKRADEALYQAKENGRNRVESSLVSPTK